jgi:hypothetical protein
MTKNIFQMRNDGDKWILEELHDEKYRTENLNTQYSIQRLQSQ